MEDQISTVRARVRALDGDDVIVEIASGGCGRCHEKGGCGGQQLTQMFCSGPKTYRLANRIGVQVGDDVLVAVTPGTIRRSANLFYGLPLCSAIVGAVLGDLLHGDSGAIFGALTGLGLAWYLVRRISGRPAGNDDFRPYLLSRS